MAAWPESFIGNLVTAGYMASYHENTIYLHDTQGNRWVAIDPHGVTIRVEPEDGRPNVHVNDLRELLVVLEGLA
jgi:sugar lactone lactonase YvrE